MSLLQQFAQGVKISPTEINAPTVAANDQALQQVLGVVYFIAGIVCVIVIIIAGVRYTTSQGESSNVQKAKNTILFAVVGLVVILVAAAVTQFIFDRL